MPAAKRRLLIENNGSKRKVFVWKDKAGRSINLTGYVARFTVKSAIEDTNALIYLSSDNGGIVLTPNRGRIELVFTQAQIDAAVAGGVYDLVLTSPSGEAIRLIEGPFAVSVGVTSA